MHPCLKPGSPTLRPDGVLDCAALERGGRVGKGGAAQERPQQGEQQQDAQSARVRQPAPQEGGQGDQHEGHQKANQSRKNYVTNVRACQRGGRCVKGRTTLS